jgi:hypothetical protein
MFSFAINLDILNKRSLARIPQSSLLAHERGRVIQGESKKTDTFDIQMNNKGVSFF